MQIGCPSTGNYVVVISGGNIAPELLEEIIHEDPA